MTPAFLDSNVFIYAAGADGPLKAPCAEILRRVGAGELDANTSVEVVQELHHVFRRRGRLADGVRLARDVVRLFPGLLSITRADVLRSGDILMARPQLSPRDALHAATALNNGITTIISVDADLEHVDGLSRLDPAGM
ncbi:type II toxin-antitoxin system VapC family toxin [Myxococcota bacterium]|nr:type II toxin-antitoxin system VapC family toxin [Myxococcota bacterium]